MLQLCSKSCAGLHNRSKRPDLLDAKGSLDLGQYQEQRSGQARVCHLRTCPTMGIFDNVPLPPVQTEEGPLEIWVDMHLFNRKDMISWLTVRHAASKG